jgi:FkbM family methyltransferase
MRLGSRLRNRQRKLSCDKPVVLEDAYGVRFILEPSDSDLEDARISGEFYRDEFEALRRLINTGDTVFDVGANVGLHTVMFSRWVGERGRVFAFEPVPDTAWTLRETLALNRCANVEVFELAILDAPGTGTMNTFDQRYAAWNSFGKPKFDEVEPSGSITVAVQTLDGFCKDEQIEHIDFLKIDVEGFEKSAIQGAATLLEAGKIDALSFEISQIPLEGSGVKPKEIFGALEAHGYAAYRYDPETRGFVGPVADSDAFYENYYASRMDL